MNPANNHTYLLTSQRLDALSARLQAQAFGGYLVAINDAAENAFLVQSFAPLMGINAWIGLSDEVTEGTFLWDSGEPLTYTNWIPGEPNNLFDEDYVEIQLGLPNLGMWNDNRLPPAGPLNYGIIELPNPSYGPPNTHLEFTATGPFSGSSVVTAPTNVLSGLGDFTVEFWVKHSVASTVGYHDVIANFGGCSGTGSWSQRTMAIGTYQGSVSVLLNSVPGSSGFVGVGTVSLVGGGLEGWHHVSVVRSGATVTSYVDGALDPWTVTTGPYATQLFSITGPIQIGGSPCGGMVDGGIDELRVWDVALSPTQIAAQARVSLPGTTPNLIAYWRFDEGGGMTAANSAAVSGTALDGSLVSVAGGPTPSWQTRVQGQPCMSPADQSVAPGASFQFSLTGPPGAPFAIAVDLDYAVNPTPFGNLGLALTPAFGILFDGISIPTPSFQIGPTGSVALPALVSPSEFIGTSIYVQALVQDPTAPNGYVLSQNGLDTGPNTASSRVSITGIGASKMDFVSATIEWPVQISDVAPVNGSPAVWPNPTVSLPVESHTFHPQDLVRFSCMVTGGSAQELYRVSFEVHSISSIIDSYSRPTPFSLILSAASGTTPGTSSSVELFAEIAGGQLPTGTYQVHGFVERQDANAPNGWARVNSTIGLTPPPVPLTTGGSVPSGWLDHVFYVTSSNTRHVVLVHGIQFGAVPGPDATGEGTFGDLESLLETTGPENERLPVREFIYDTWDSIPVLATKLQSFLTHPAYGIASATPCPDFVCHSMGGLVARQWLSTATIASGQQPRVVFLGTPHYGSPCANNAPVSIASVNDMKQGSQFLADLHSAWVLNPPPVLALDVIGGGGAQGPHGPGDGPVPAYSANLGPGGVGLPGYGSAFLSTHDHTGAFANWPAWLAGCLPTGGQHHLVPIAGASHAAYSPIRDFLVNGVLPAAAPVSDRACVWIQAPDGANAYLQALPVGVNLTTGFLNIDPASGPTSVWVFQLAPSATSPTFAIWDRCSNPAPWPPVGAPSPGLPCPGMVLGTITANLTAGIGQTTL